MQPQRIKRFLARTAMVAALSVPFLATRMSPAGFSKQEVRMHVEIDGVNYGVFDRIEGLGLQSDESRPLSGSSLRRVSFNRDFVTDPSLYLWAKNIMYGRSELKDVHVVLASRDGEELSRYVLRFCQPLAWSLEAANPAQGGFHEKIEMAVQDVSVR